MSGNIIDFKERLEDDLEFKTLFVMTENLDEVVELARENGYDIEVDDVLENAELISNLMETIVGGVKNASHLSLLKNKVMDSSETVTGGERIAYHQNNDTWLVVDTSSKKWWVDSGLPVGSVRKDEHCDFMDFQFLYGNYVFDSTASNWKEDDAWNDWKHHRR